MNQYEKWFEKRERRSEKRPETCPKNVKPLSRRLKISHRHFLKDFHSPKFAQREVVFSPRGSAAAAALRMYPRSGFWYRGTSECNIVPVFGKGEYPNVPLFRFLVQTSAKTTLLETTLLRTLDPSDTENQSCPDNEKNAASKSALSRIAPSALIPQVSSQSGHGTQNLSFFAGCVFRRVGGIFEIRDA